MKKMLIFMIIVALVLIIPKGEVFGQSAGIVSIDSISGERGDKVALPVSLTGNTYNIAGFFVPVKYSMDNLILDSVSFVGSFLPGNFAGYFSEDLVEDAVVISCFYSDYNNLTAMHSPNGLMGTIYFTIKADADPGNFKIDSVYNIIDYGVGVGVDEQLIYLADSSGENTYYPDFDPGSVLVQVPTGIEDELNNGLPSEFSLAQNYPNPFNPTTSIEFSLPASSSVTLEVFNVLGQKVDELANGHFSAGSHIVEFDASEHSSGVFFYRLSSDQGIQTKKMLLVK
ncbi:MAG: T9SS C-terminal target domain-containing protein [Calditrichaeota bacterium]|nr:MAG: T9SS C-terminal target domain-containing protein [Calditrichota bacterium]